MQYTAIIHGCKNVHFQMKFVIFFLFLLKTLIVGTREMVLTSTHNLCFRAKVRRNVYPCKPHFYSIKAGCKGCTLHRLVRMMVACFVVSFGDVSPYVCTCYFGSVYVAEWPPFGKELLTRFTICSLCIMSICDLSYFQFWFLGRDVGYGYYFT